MTRQNAIQTQQQTASASPLSRGGILQRQCEGCGQHTISGGECGECGKKKIGLQRKLTIGASNDPLELEADRIADRVMSASPNSVVNSAPPRIQRFTVQTTAQAGMVAPASVDSVLSSPGSPLEPALQQDMGQRFGHDFSRVRVHTDAAAARSAQDVNANAYTVGHNIVFGERQLAPETNAGRRLIAHELTHVLQQLGTREIRNGHGSEKRSLSRNSTTIQRQFAGETADEVLRRKAQESGANWAKGGNPINPSAEKSHFSPVERQAFIRGYLDYARRHNLTKQFEEARKAYPWADQPAFDVPNAIRDWSKPPLPDSPRRVEPDMETKEEKSKRSDQIDAPNLEESTEPRRPDEPTASTAALDPRSNSDYVERRCTGVGFGIYVGITTVHGGGYLLYCNGLELPVLLPAAYVNFGLARAVPVNGVIHNSREDAISHIPVTPPAPGQSQPYTFYRGSGGLIVPTVFSPGTTPRLVELMLDARRRLAKEVTDELTVLAITIVGARLQLVVRGLANAGGRAFEKALKNPPKSPLSGSPAKPSVGELTPRSPELAPAAAKPSTIEPQIPHPTTTQPKSTTTQAPKAAPPPAVKTPATDEAAPPPAPKAPATTKAEISETETPEAKTTAPKKAETPEAKTAPKPAKTQEVNTEPKPEEPKTKEPTQTPEAKTTAPKKAETPETETLEAKTEPAKKPTTVEEVTSRMEQLRNDSQRLSNAAKADDPKVAKARNRYQTANREAEDLSSEVVGQKALTREAVEKNPALKDQYSKAQKVRQRLREAEKERNTAEAEYNILKAEQDARYEQIRKNNAEVEQLSRPELALPPMQRGTVNEMRVLKEEGLLGIKPQLTVRDPKTGEWGVTIPDGVRSNGRTVDVKDVAELSETQQLRLQREYSRQRGQKPEIITGTKTKVPAEMEENYIIQRRPDLGPR
jgi:hypothetical protein